MQTHEKRDYERLRAEGRWSQASEFREAERQRLRSAGRSKQQARDESWAAMLVKFPPQGQVEPAQRQSAANATDSEPQFCKHDQDAAFADELKQLALLTKGQITDADRDIDYAYRMMGLASLSPLDCPSMPAWEWWRYSRQDSMKFLDVVAKREDAKSKAAGTVTTKAFEDDKRTQFAMIDRILESVAEDAEATVRDLAKRFPDELQASLRHLGWTVVEPSATPVDVA